MREESLKEQDITQEAPEEFAEAVLKLMRG